MDQIAADNPNRVAAIEWHVSSDYPLYCAEGWSKWHSYPPPFQGSYGTPWAWIDGVSRTYAYSQWPAYVESAMAVPSVIDVRLDGWYNPGSRAGEVEVMLTNSTPDDVSARANVVLTEDSLFYVGPNGDSWHNHVCRDYVPGPTGTAVTIPGNGSDTLILPLTLGQSWDEEHCRVVVYIQEDQVRPDSSRPVYQAGSIGIGTLAGVAEGRPGLRQVAGCDARVLPNPLTERARISFNCPVGRRFEAAVYGVDGRLVRRFTGTGAGPETTVDWNRNDGAGRRAGEGVYTLLVTAGGWHGTARLVVSGH